MNAIEKNITAVIKNITEEFKVMLIDLHISGSKKILIQIYIDGIESISAGLCAEISRAINKKIEDELDITSSYRIEVSSPGVDRSLKFLQQYYKHLNRNFSLNIIQEDTEVKVEGKLISITGDDLTFSLHDNKELIVNFQKIKKAFVNISFS